jgi:hypothetical protein
MTVSVTNYGNNPEVPGAWDASYYPDNLIAGDKKIVTDNQAVITGAAILKRGTVLGQVTATGAYRLAVATAADGSQNPCAVLADLTDATAGDVAGAVYIEAEVNGNRLIFDPSFTVAAIKAALRPLSLIVKFPVSAVEPT